MCVLKTLTNTIKNTPGFETLRTIICGNDHLRFCGIRLCVFKLALSSASSSVLLLLGFRMTILLIKGLSLPGITLLSLLKNTYILGFSSTKNYVTCTVGAHWLVSAWGGRAAGISGTAYAKELSGFELKSARQRVINLTVSSVKQFIARTPSPLFFPSPPQWSHATVATPPPDRPTVISCFWSCQSPEANSKKYISPGGFTDMIWVSSIR